MTELEYLIITYLLYPTSQAQKTQGTSLTLPDMYMVTEITGYDALNSEVDGFTNSNIEILTLPDS